MNSHECCSWFQCQTCGTVFPIYRRYKKNTFFIDSYCSHCKETETILFLGNDRDNIYEFFNPNLDNRIY